MPRPNQFVSGVLHAARQGPMLGCRRPVSSSPTLAGQMCLRASSAADGTRLRCGTTRSIHRNGSPSRGVRTAAQAPLTIMYTVVKRAGRPVAAVIGLLLLAGCALLMGILTVRGSQDDAARVARFLGVVLAIPALAIPLVVWWRRGAVATAPTAEQLSQARDTLAGVVAGQWRQEALARSLGDPEPMPVCWGLTEGAVMDHPRLIMGGLLSFTGRSDQIGPLAAEFRRLRRRRLVILGGAGSGKTTLAVQLLLELLATRQPGEPIPVLVSLAGWDPIEQPRLQEWLATRLAEDYPLLRGFGPHVARALAVQGHLLPVLDGLDELPQSRQPEVIAALNASLTDADHLVLTSRTVEYITAITEARDVLTAAAVIKPEPLTPTQAADYLTHCLPVDPGPSWHEVLSRLRAGTAGPLATVLATPLGLWLLRTVYVTPYTDPSPLLNLDASHPRGTVQADLFDKLIPSVLATRPASRDHSDPFRPHRTWNSNDVQSWLTYLAQHLHRTGTRDLQWWHLARDTLTRRTVGVTYGLMYGLTFGLFYGLTYALVVGLRSGLAFGLAYGLTAGLAMGLVARRWLTAEPAYANLQLKHRATLLARQLAFGLPVGLAVGLVVGLANALAVGLAWVGLLEGLRGGLPVGLRFGLPVGLMFGLTFGLIRWVGTPSKTGWASTPRSTYKATRALTALEISLFGLACGLAGWLAGGPRSWPWVGLTFGLTFGLVFVSSGAWLSHVLATWRLAASSKLPFRLMDFLDDAYRLGLLRTIGPAYQFRHAEFHDHLNRAGSTQPKTTAAPGVILKPRSGGGTGAWS
jgi:hypothetical protein